jgi:hypothetical protein
MEANLGAVEVALLHLGEEIPALDVLVGRLGRQRGVVATRGLPLGRGGLGCGLAHQRREALFFALRHGVAPGVVRAGRGQATPEC